jgi:glycosyltransferase 2 family protein
MPSPGVNAGSVALTLRSTSSRVLRPLTIVIVIGFAIHILLPQIGEIGKAFAALRSGRWRYLGVSLLGVVLTYVAGASMVRASTELRPPFGRTVMGQVAASFMATVTPAGLGWIAVTQTFLQRAGVDEDTAGAATTLNMFITFISHLAMLAILLPFLPTLKLPTIQVPSTPVIVEVVLVVMLVIGVAMWIPATRRSILTHLLGLVRAVPGVLSSPRRSAVMVAGAFAGNLAFALALSGAVAAFGPSPSFLGILVAYMLGATLSTVSPTPGGLGVMEAALVSALVRLGVEPGAAVAAVLTFRLGTFWLPLPVGALMLRQGRRMGWL